MFGLHFLYLIFKLSQEERQQVLNCVVLAQYGGKAHYDRGQSGLHMLVGVWDKFLDRDGTHKTEGKNTHELAHKIKILTNMPL